MAASTELMMRQFCSSLIGCNDTCAMNKSNGNAHETSSLSVGATFSHGSFLFSACSDILFIQHSSSLWVVRNFQSLQFVHRLLDEGWADLTVDERRPKRVSIKHPHADIYETKRTVLSLIGKISENVWDTFQWSSIQISRAVFVNQFPFHPA